MCGDADVVIAGVVFIGVSVYGFILCLKLQDENHNETPRVVYIFY